MLGGVVVGLEDAIALVEADGDADCEEGGDEDEDLAVARYGEEFFLFLGGGGRRGCPLGVREILEGHMLGSRGILGLSNSRHDV